MTSTELESQAKNVIKHASKKSAELERSADNAVTFASEAPHRVSHDLQKAASVIAERTQELVNRENMEKAWGEARAIVRRHPVQTSLIVAGVAVLAAGAVFAMSRRPSRSFFS